MTAWWRSLRVLPAQRRRKRVGFRHAAVFGVEQLESRRLLAVWTTDLETNPGFALSETALMVSESGTSNSFSVALTAQPSTDVFLSVVSGDTSEATVSDAVLTFTASNWDQPQWVMVAGVDDPLVDGDQVTQITVSIDSAASDGSFADVPAQWVTVTTTDNDVAGLSISRATAGVSEFGSTDTFTVALTVQPVSDVVLSVTSGDTGEVTVQPATLAFTPANWNVPQTVTLTGVNDDVIDGIQTTLVAVSVVPEVSDSHFAELADRTVSVSTFDNDFAGFTVNKNTASVAETGTTDTCAVVLTAQPDVDVVLAVTSGDTGEVTVSPAALTFTPANWNTPQTVTVQGVDDDWDDDIRYTTVTVSIDTVSTDPKFAAVDNRHVVVFTDDDDEAGLVTNTSSVQVSENGTTGNVFACRLEYLANGDGHGRGRSPARRQPDDAGRGQRGRRRLG